MFKIMLIAEEGKEESELRSRLAESGFACRVVSGKEAAGQVIEQAPDLLLVDVTARPVKEVTGDISEKSLPVIALVRQDLLANINGHLDGASDFLVKPCCYPELELRIRRILHPAGAESGGEQIRYGDLVIDLAECAVTVAGRPIDLTFREYELLKFLASNRGRVYSRESLLNKVWGFDYYGGDRTVDVHIRRLRSNIEDANHTFIETVRSIGYRFRENHVTSI